MESNDYKAVVEYLRWVYTYAQKVAEKMKSIIDNYQTRDDDFSNA